MTARFKSIAEKGGLPVHLMTLGIEPEYFYHLDDMRNPRLSNPAIASLIQDKYGRRIHKETIGKWRKIKAKEQSGQEDKSAGADRAEVG